MKVFGAAVLMAIFLFASSPAVFGENGVEEKAGDNVRQRCERVVAKEGLTAAQSGELCSRTVASFLELASSRDLAEAAANDFKKETSAKVFAICYGIALQEYKQ